MELDLGPEIAQFRAELREWIAAQTPPGLVELTDWNTVMTAGGNRGARLARAWAHPAYAEWTAKLAARRLICPHWPEEYGGQGMGAVHLAVLNEEFHRAGVPRVTRGMGESLVGPSVIVHGTPEQKAYFLPRIINGEDVYCQGFSEPNHGSDLAAVETRGVVEGDEIVITGQKVWTSGAARATRMFALVRTDPEAEKHRGLSYVLFDFKGPGVSYRPIRQLSGASEFAEDFLDGVRAPLFNVIGGLNNGWRVAMTTLGHERGGNATVAHLAFQREFWDLVETARKRGKSGDPLVRQQLAWAYTQAEIMRFSGLRTLAQVAKGRPPGPEASVAKLFWSEYHKRLGEIAMGIEGSDGLLRPDGDGYAVSKWQNVFLSSRAGTIYSGTSEIQRNIIGERALGLPKEPRVAGLRMTQATAAAGPSPEGTVGQRAANYQASRRLVTPGRLREFFAPRSISMVGASENSGWARFIVVNCGLTGFAGPLTAVHPRAKRAFGLPVAPSLRDLDEPPDLAFILAPLPAVESVLDDMGAAGVRSAVVLASGYREVGAEGRALEDSMISRAIANDVTVLGPNCLGYLNAHTGAAPYSLTLPPPLTAGGVGIALQSGALASVVLTFAKAHAIGLSVLTSVGNESMMKTVDVIDYFVEDPATRVIALFLEEIGDPVRFAQAAARADAAGKPIVALKVGSSPAGQQAALAHTGSVAGDDAVVSAALRQMNIVRVTSLEELLTTAALLASSAAPRGRRMGVLSASGGACDIIADAASALGISIPDFSPATEAAIAAVLPPFASARNPLDVTGYGGLANLGARTARSAIDVALDAAADDPNLDFILYTGLTLPAVRPPDEAMATMMESKLDWFAQRVASSPIPVIPVSSTCVDLAGYGREQLASRGLYLLPGLNGSIEAIGNALRWAENRGSRWAAADAAAARETAKHATVTGPWSEARARDLLTAAGVPVVPGGLARSADEAADISANLGLPVALKVCSAQITHKSDVGGVALGLRTEAEVRAAFEKVRAADEAVPGAQVEGVLVTPMRAGGTELLAGVTVDPSLGPVLAVGLGGVWVEVLADTALRVLPADAAAVKAMLGELRGLPLLRGARGTEPADLDALAAVIARIGETALSLGRCLRALEVNPLLVNGDRIEALDVLIVTEDATRPDGASADNTSAL